ncbi:MAG: O-antigen ligase family protein [Vulcanimicrobiaceae bacterium]
MRFQVVDAFPVPIPIDPLMATVFTAFFAVCALVTVRRPAFGLAILLAIQPFAASREVFSTAITLPKMALLGVILGLTAWRGRGRLPRPGAWRGVTIAVLLLVAATALSAANAQHRVATLTETLKYAEYAVLFVAALVAFHLDPDDGVLLAAAASSACVVAVGALAQLFVGTPSGMHVGTAVVPRISGALEGPNQLAAYFETAVAIVGAWMVARPSRWKAAVLALCTFATMLTISRAGIFSLAVVGAVLLVFRGRAAFAALAPMLAAGVAGGAAAVAIAHSVGIFRFTLAGTDYAGGVGTRGELWRAAWTLWRRHPVFGVGAGNFELELSEAGLEGVRTHANNWYLQALVEGGPLLLAATIGFVVSACATLWKNARAGSPWILAALAASIALGLHQIVDYLFFYPKVAGPWFILLGIALATLSAPDETAAACAPSS